MVEGWKIKVPELVAARQELRGRRLTVVKQVDKVPVAWRGCTWVAA
jgi:hypothetical protein